MTQKSEQALISYKFQILACQISEDCDLELSEKIASQEYLHVQLEVWKKQRSGLPKLRKLIFVFLFEFCFQNMLSKNNYCSGFPRAVSAVTFMTAVQENFHVVQWERDLLTLCLNCIT